MVLVIDVGNTNIVIGVYENKDKLRLVARIATDPNRTDDQYAIEIKEIINLYGINQNKIEGSIMSSVVPQITVILKRALYKIFGFTPIIVGPGMKTGLNIRSEYPSETGGDIIVASVAATLKYTVPAIVVDMGTATKLIVIDKDRALIGAIFCPGVRIASEALAQKAALLPQVSLEAPGSVIGTSTIPCMMSGIVYGNACMIDGLIERIEEEMGPVTTVIATGGHSKDIYPYCKRKIVYDNELLLDGLYYLYTKNTKQAII